ncbi:MAG: tRNA (adenosine(37)-N6)-threonylcarbamoyltransferase complex dimerization subunit type 1 TsaB [Erysipelotrichaceae bacterium]|jgi:tRNA threonylcarbamoyl adenosine modification protein YeaZ/ribosomal-protein-alanine acetyltransferase|nr:tRNA (adenosine(37)-N6)-threonylcarbamoyltransferase complex dimerization subunit type 1 TsaB [Erysipelotrichaceae bacterium]
MYTLCLDSSNDYLLIELYQDNVLLARKFEVVHHEQSTRLVSEINEMLEHNNLNATLIKRIVVTVGPGSYTGIRIGLTVAKVFGTVKNLEVMLISSFALYSATLHGRVHVIFNARAHRSYYALYENGTLLQPETVIYNSDLKVLVKQNALDTFVGNLEHLGELKPPFFQEINTSFPPFVASFHSSYKDPRLIKPPYTYPLKFDFVYYHLLLNEPEKLEIAVFLDELERQEFIEAPKIAFYQNNLYSEFVQVILIKMDQRIVGYISFLNTFESASIIRIFILKAYRKLGLATRLLEEFHTYLKNSGVLTVTLEVRVSNQNALKLYRNFKYEEITVKMAYYDDGEAAIYMVKDLSL